MISRMRQITDQKAMNIKDRLAHPIEVRLMLTSPAQER